MESDLLRRLSVRSLDTSSAGKAKDSMTPKQYIEAIDRLGLSQRAAGRFLGVDERQSRRWAAGDSAIPESVAKLLRLMIRLKLPPEDVT
jgi:DNA-binding transcriptional regulator YiaG